MNSLGFIIFLIAAVAELARSPLYRGFTKRAESCSACRDFGTVEISQLWRGSPASLWNAIKILK